jgi:hypothetical protein
VAHCCRCGAETQLYVNGLPVCMNCDKAQPESDATRSNEGSKTDPRSKPPGQAAGVKLRGVR